MKFGAEEFEDLLGVKLGDRAKREINSFGIIYSVLSHTEQLRVAKELIDEIFRLDLPSASRKRQPQWEEGWGQNLLEFKQDKSAESLLPKYFGKNPVNRLNQELVQGEVNGFELALLRCIESWIFEEYLCLFENIYEFGCGTGHNLLFLRKFTESANLVGLDWVDSSQELIKLISVSKNDAKLSGYKFDYFAPDLNFKLRDNSAVFTVASLEQIGDKFEPFVHFLLQNKPKLVVHIEPFEDLLDPYNLLDNLSIQYMRRRKYISGYVKFIEKLQIDGKAKIHRYQRTLIGSKHIDGYTVLVWSPVS